MHKAILKIYIKGKIRSLVTLEIIPGASEKLEDLVKSTIEDLNKSLNDKSLDVVRIQDITFNRKDFHYHTVKYK